MEPDGGSGTEKADVVVETFRPGVIDRLGIGYEAMCEHKPDIVLCSISGYGQSGPFVARAGHDLNYIGLAGVLEEQEELKESLSLLEALEGNYPNPEALSQKIEQVRSRIAKKKKAI